MSISTHFEACDSLERDRLSKLKVFEERAYQKKYSLIAGVDEAGRGPLAGPVVAAACILPRHYILAGINDSKKLTPRKRKKIYDHLTSDSQVIYSIARCDPSVIDRINIYQATLRCMLDAVHALKVKADYLLVDGMHLVCDIPSEKIIKGDSLSISIAAASIIAKVTRDELMLDYHKRWPHYGFDTHKGYGTAKHIQAIQDHGPCSIHRLSFAPLSHCF